MNCKQCHKKMEFKERIGSIRFFRCLICDCITEIKVTRTHRRKPYLNNQISLFGASVISIDVFALTIIIIQLIFYFPNLFSVVLFLFTCIIIFPNLVYIFWREFKNESISTSKKPM